MIITQYASKRERSAIEQAIEIIDSNKVRYGYNSSPWRRNGWAGPYVGAFKRAYIKSGVVVKHGPKIQTRRELRLWLSTYLNPAKRKYRKNLARCFGIYKGWLFQRYIKSHPREYAMDCRKIGCNKIARALRIYDWQSHNHRHDKNKNPIWFDTYDYW